MTSEEIKAKLELFKKSKTDEDLIKEEAFVLMSGYLSEIERLQEVLGFTKKDMAEKIKTSASYLTQVFKGDKPLNFITLAKLQLALDIRFRIKAIPVTNTMTIVNENNFFDKIHQYKCAKQGVWIYKNNHSLNPSYNKQDIKIQKVNDYKAIAT